MDSSNKAEKKSFRIKYSLLFWIFILSLVSSAFIGGAYLVASQDLPRVDRIRKCFTTSMFKVKLCPGSSNYVPYKNFPKHLIDALIVSEDAGFWGHQGFDWYEIKQSFRKNIIEGRIARGGSTITQQLAKNLYLTPDKSITRKFREMFIANKIELILSKKEILEKYLNVVEFGKNLYGIQSASQKYFQMHPADLNIEQAVYLVSLLPNPKLYSKSFTTGQLTKTNTQKMKVIFKRLLHYKKIPSQSYDQALAITETNFWNPQEVSPTLWMTSDTGNSDSDASEELVGESFEATENPEPLENEGQPGNSLGSNTTSENAPTLDEGGESEQDSAQDLENTDFE